MAELIVEDGTGKPGAESYVTVNEADAYHAKMGNSDWPQYDGQDEDPDLAKKQASLRKSAVFLDSYVLPKVNGVKKNPDQGLLFPRVGATDYSGAPIDADSVPESYKNAQCEAALSVFTGQQLTPESQAGPLLKRKKTDVLEKEWFEGSYSQKPVFGWLDSILAGLFGPATSNNGLRVIPIGRG